MMTMLFNLHETLNYIDLCETLATSYSPDGASATVMQNCVHALNISILMNSDQKIIFFGENTSMHYAKRNSYYHTSMKPILCSVEHLVSYKLDIVASLFIDMKDDIFTAASFTTRVANDDVQNVMEMYQNAHK